jgi:hypothetical protein
MAFAGRAGLAGGVRSLATTPSFPHSRDTWLLSSSTHSSIADTCAACGGVNCQPRTTRTSVAQRTRSSRTAAPAAAARKRASESARVFSMTACRESMVIPSI